MVRGMNDNVSDRLQEVQLSHHLSGPIGRIWCPPQHHVAVHAGTPLSTSPTALLAMNRPQQAQAHSQSQSSIMNSTCPLEATLSLL